MIWARGARGDAGLARAVTRIALAAPVWLASVAVQPAFADRIENEVAVFAALCRPCLAQSSGPRSRSARPSNSAR